MKQEFVKMLVVFGLFIFCLFASIKMKGQDAPKNYLFVGGGIGLSNYNMVVNSQLGYNTKVIGVEGSIIAHADNKNPALFSVQAIKSFHESSHKISLLAGYSYHLRTVDTKRGSEGHPIFGMEWASVIDYRGAVIYIRGQISGKHFSAMIGIKGIFVRQ
jgi:hypothetical protein